MNKKLNRKGKFLGIKVFQLRRLNYYTNKIDEKDDLDMLRLSHRRWVSRVDVKTGGLFFARCG